MWHYFVNGDTRILVGFAFYFDANVAVRLSTAETPHPHHSGTRQAYSLISVR